MCALRCLLLLICSLLSWNVTMQLAGPRLRRDPPILLPTPWVGCVSRLSWARSESICSVLQSALGEHAVPALHAVPIISGIAAKNNMNRSLAGSRKHCECLQGCSGYEWVCTPVSVLFSLPLGSQAPVAYRCTVMRSTSLRREIGLWEGTPFRLSHTDKCQCSHGKQGKWLANGKRSVKIDEYIVMPDCGTANLGPIPCA